MEIQPENPEFKSNPEYLHQSAVPPYLFVCWELLHAF